MPHSACTQKLILPGECNLVMTNDIPLHSQHTKCTQVGPLPVLSKMRFNDTAFQRFSLSCRRGFQLAKGLR